MKVITIADNGTLTLELTAAEARQIRDDLGQTDVSTLSPAGDRLHGYLESIHGPAGNA